MSTPEQPTPPLTRKTLRDLRNTAATPIITPDEPPAEPPVVAAPLPRPAAPAEVPPAPASDESVDLGAHPLTRRQARQQERIRTASVPVITADVLAAHAAAQAEDEVSPFAPPAAATPPTEQPDSADDAADEHDEIEAELEEEERPVVNSALGADILAGDGAAVDLPASFDHILGRSGSNGTLAASNALILSQTPSSGPLVGPVTATGEVLITGTFALPEGLGSNGHAPGMTDGKDVDAALIDGELPPASSPTPIAASAAVSTAKVSGEIIQPPAPEKGGRLMMALAITAGALALTLVGVLILAVTTGVFS